MKIAENPIVDNKVPHLKCTKEDISEIVLLPGDPSRVEFFNEFLEDFKIISYNREFKVGKGNYEGVPITICSTGIGGPSTEIAVLELIELGAKVLIRIGGTGAIKEEIKCGEYILNTAALRMGGASNFYAMPQYPAVADFDIVYRLKEACKKMGKISRLGIGASVGSYYRGQGRDIFPDSNDQKCKDLYNEFIRLKITNIEMETETIFTLASLYGIKAGSICSTHCNRVTNEWMHDFEPVQKDMCKIALEACKNIYKDINES